MYGKQIWKNTSISALLEAGKALPVGTTKIYAVHDKKYHGKEVYHVYQKVDEPGKKDWQYIGTVGAKGGKADAHLKALGIEVEDDKPVGFDSSKKGKSMMVPPPAALIAPAVAPADDHAKAVAAAKADAEEYEKAIAKVNADNAAMAAANAAAQAAAQAGSDEIPEPNSVTVAIQSIFNKKMKDIMAFMKEYESFGNDVHNHFDELKAKYPELTAATGKSAASAYEMGMEVFHAPGNYKDELGNADAHKVFDNWLKTKKNMSAEVMANLYGKDWSETFWGIAAAISKHHGGPGDIDDKTTVYDEPKKAPAIAAATPALTTAGGFKILATGKGKPVPDGATKIQPEKKTGKFQVHKKSGGTWSYIGTIGAAKGKNKGDAEQHLKTLGIEVEDGKPTVLGVPLVVTDAAVTMLPTATGSVNPSVYAEPKDEPKSTFGELPVPPEETLLDPNFVPPGDSPSGLAKKAAYDNKFSGITKNTLDYIDGKTNNTIQGNNNADLAHAMLKAAHAKYDPKASDDDNMAVIMTSHIKVSLTADKLKQAYGPDWAYKFQAIAKDILKAAKAGEAGFAGVGGIEPPKKKVYPIPSAAIQSQFKGFKELYDIVNDAGGVAAVSPKAKAIFDKHHPGWQMNVALAQAIKKQAAISGEPTAALDMDMSLYGPDTAEKKVEIYKHLYGGYPGEETGSTDTSTPVAPLVPEPLPVAVEPEKPKKKKKEVAPPPVPVTPPPPAPPPVVSVSDKVGFKPAAKGTAAADLPIPPPSGLTLSGSANALGGAGDKAFYVDANGNKFLFKLAAKKDGKKTPDPMRAYVQAGFSEIAKKIKPIHPKIEVTKLGGAVGAIYPFLPGADKLDLSGESPSSLTPQAKLDVAEEHVIDWLMSQHDSHSKNFLRTPDGRIVGVDKEQGFKYFGSDSLSIDYHPNSMYGENEPYYNAFWREFGQGKNDFDPKQLSGAIDRAMNVSRKDMEAALKPYLEIRFPGSAIDQENFLRQVLNRKNTIKRDFEKMITEQYKKRTSSTGEFTFAQGWMKEGDEAKPYEKIIKHAETKQTASDMLSALGGKTVPHVSDPTKVTVKTNSDQAEFAKMLEGLGFTEEAKNIKIGGHYKMAFIDKVAWEKAGKVTPAWTETKMIYPEPKGLKKTPAVPEYMPKVDPPKKPKPNSKFFKEINPKTKLGLGAGVTLDGPAVEAQRARVIRKKDDKGNYYEVSFKLRETAHKTIKGGTTSTFEFKVGSLSDKTDTLSATSTKIDTAPSKRWQSDAGEIDLLATHDDSKFSYKGMVVAKVRLEDVEKGLKELLNQMSPGFANEVVRDPTPEEQEVAALSTALYAYAPQVSDSLSKKEVSGTWKRTKENILKELTKVMTPEQIAAVSHSEAGETFVSGVLPGRWKTIAGGQPEDPQVRFLFWEVSTPEKVVNMFSGTGAAGINERNIQGLKAAGSSYGSDVGTGCASGMTVRVATKNVGGQTSSGGYGSIRVIVAPDEVDRLDAFLHKGDKYGCMNPDGHGHQSTGYNTREPLDKALKTATLHDELVVRQLMPKGKILRVACDSESERASIITAFKKEGMTEVNGVPVEDFVVYMAGKSVNQMYETYVKPAGY